MLSGDDSLRARPMGRVVEPLRAMGARVHGRDGATRAPLVVRGGVLRGVRYVLPVASRAGEDRPDAGGLAGRRGHGDRVAGTESRSQRADARRPRRAVTVDGLSIRVVKRHARSFALDVPGDPSSAAFFAVAAAITPGSDIVIESVSCKPTRVGFVAVLRRMGADVELTTRGEVCGEPVGELRVRASELHGTTISGDEIPDVIDEIPASRVAAAFAEGVTEIGTPAGSP